MSTLTDVVSPALRQCGTRRAKEEAEVGFTRMRQLQGVASNVEADVPNLLANLDVDEVVGDMAKEGTVVAAAMRMDTIARVDGLINLK